MVFVCVTAENYREIQCIICHPNFLSASVYCVKCLAFLFILLLHCLELLIFFNFVQKSTCTSGLLSTKVFHVQSMVSVHV